MKLIETILSLLGLIKISDVFWIVLPLAIATIAVIFYFQKYKSERPSWNDYFANSLVILFVSMNLIKHIYEIGNFGMINFLEYPYKSIAVIILLYFGIDVAKLNFEHLFPEKLSRYISSPLTINTLVYVVILYVYTNMENSFLLFLSLIIIWVVIIAALNLIKWPIRKSFEYLEEQRRKDRIRDVKEEEFEIKELKRKLKEKEELLKNAKFKEADKEKSEAVKIEKIIRKGK